MFFHPLVFLKLLRLHWQIFSLEMFLESADEEREVQAGQIEMARAELEQLYLHRSDLQELNFV